MSFSLSSVFNVLVFKHLSKIFIHIKHKAISPNTMLDWVQVGLAVVADGELDFGVMDLQ